ncbi:MAG: threonine aldolase family protein [Acidobacteria bacterium]|nr:threonine aldolase family protein [Acidobacteriota bacterium]
MTRPFIPLSSDTETRPTEAMRRAIAAAEVGDEQRAEDPSVLRIQERVAELTGKEAALFMPTGTMCNVIAVKTHTHAADAVIAEHMSHVIRAETGGMGLVSGLMIEPIVTERGIFTPDEIDDAIRRLSSAPFPYAPVARLLCVEQTHNFGGGSVWTKGELAAVYARAKERSLAVHMDGARLMNAVVASGAKASEFGASTDSLWIDFTKGLGAPMGAALAGSKAFIAEARRYKHMFGGAMRQAGVIAAGCLHALDHHVERLAEDHDNARRLAEGLGAIRGIRLATPTPESNIIFFDVSGLGTDNRSFVANATELGVRFSPVGSSVRAVTHLDVSRDDIETAIQIVERMAKAGS